MERNSNNKPRRGLIGIGLDNKDGHKRLTTGEQFAIVGGSADTHERMTETVIKTTETLKKRGKDFDTAEPKEIVETLASHAAS